MKKTVRYALEEAINGYNAVEITVGTVTLFGMGEYAKLQATYRFRFEELAGLDHGKQVSVEEYNKIDADLRTLNNLWSQWARIRTAVRKVRVANDDQSFVDASLAEVGWDSLEGLNAMPVDLLDALDKATIQCNPGVFGGLYAPDNGESDPNARKVGVIKVS